MTCGSDCGVYVRKANNADTQDNTLDKIMGSCEEKNNTIKQRKKYTFTFIELIQRNIQYIQSIYI